MRGRQYPWGVVDIENTDHSDFVFLKKFLIQTHMQVRFVCYPCNLLLPPQDLKDVTHDVHYENYRLTCLGELRAQGIAVGEGSGERKRMSSKRLVCFIEKTHVSQTFCRESIVPSECEYEDPETMMLLHQKDQEIKKMQAMLEQMQHKLNSGS